MPCSHHGTLGSVASVLPGAVDAGMVVGGMVVGDGVVAPGPAVPSLLQAARRAATEAVPAPNIDQRTRSRRLKFSPMSESVTHRPLSGSQHDRPGIVSARLLIEVWGTE